MTNQYLELVTVLSRSLMHFFVQAPESGIWMSHRDYAESSVG